VDVPQIGGQLGKFSFDIEPAAIPEDQSADGKSVSHIMQPWTTAVALCWHAEAELLGELGEGVSSRRSGNPPPTLGDEEGWSRWCGKEATSSFGVLFQSLYRGRMNGDITRFTKLRSLDMKGSTIEVDIRSVQAENFVRARAESLARGELLGSTK
jgi:hypothetical protein